MFSAQKEFKIGADVKVRIHLSDNHNIAITINNFEAVVRNYCKSGSFYINLQYEIQNQSCDVITPQVNVAAI